MRKAGFLLQALIIFSSFTCYAQYESHIQSRILILLDESSSMIKPWAGGPPKYKVADDLIMRLMDSVYEVNSDVQFSLRVFGHQNTVEENNCYDTKNEVPFSHDNRTQMSLRLSAIRPLGVTPIAYSLAQAAEFDLDDPERNAYSIILITDGGESCGGDICAIMHDLIRKKVYFKPYIIGLEDDATLATIYACMGDYLQVTKNDDVSRAVNTIITAFHPMLNINKKEYKEIQVSGPPPVTESGISAKKAILAETKKVSQKPTPVKLLSVEQAHAKPLAIATAKLATRERFPLSTIPSLPPLRKDSAVASFAVAFPPARPLPKKINILPPSSLKQFTEQKPALMVSQALVLVQLPPLPPLVKEDVPPPSPPPPVPVVAPPAKRGRDTLTTAPATAVKALPDAGLADYKITSIDARETSLELYFVNENGRYCLSEPLVRLVDHKTGKVERSFHREIDRLANIEVQTKIQPGYYDLVFPNKKNLVMNNVLFEPKKKNKIVVRVKDTRLTFAYIGAPGRPVKEFNAVVTRLNAPPGMDRVQLHKCVEDIAYDPGTYKIEINTLPRIIDTADFDFNNDTTISIIPPGQGKFTVTNLPKHFVKLYCEKAGKYYPFYTLDVNEPESQHLLLQPGNYQVRYEQGRKGTVSPELTLPFTITSDTETEIKLE